MFITPLCYFSLYFLCLVTCSQPNSSSIRKSPFTKVSPYNTTWPRNYTAATGLLSNATPYQNSTTTLREVLTVTRTATLPAEACCFVVQDTINVRYWAHYSTTTVFYTMNATALITSYTHYIDTIVTNYNTSVTALPTSSALSFDIALPQIPNYNGLPGPVTTSVELNGTKTTVDGSTIMSPVAFYEFSSVRIIVVPAVTDQSGQLVCTTTSIYNPPCTGIVDDGGTQFSGINAYAESYFGGSSNGQLSNSTTGASANMSSFSLQDVAEIHFSTPFVYLPPDGANEELGPMPAVEVQTADGTITFFINEPAPTISISNDNSDQDYGYVPQALIDWMAKNPSYVSQYPYLASCYPGGPSIKPDNIQESDGECSTTDVSPVYASAVSDLTASTQVTVSSAGCFNPGACPTPAPAATPNPVVPANTASFVVPEEASVVPTAPEQSQSQKATIANSPMRAPGLGGIIASALGGSPFALSPNVPSSTAPAPPLTPSPNAPSLTLPAPHVPQPSVPSQNALTPDVAGSLIITVGSQSITLGSASNFVIAGQTLQPGAPEITFQGTPVSLGLSASVIVVAGSTVTLPTAVNAPAITVGLQSITLNSASHYVVAGKTLTPGAPPINIEGTPVSVALSASAIVVAGSTIALPVPVNTPVITIGDHPITANSASQYMIGSKTLIPGGTAITVSGTMISLAPSGTQVVIGSSTIPLLTGENSVPSPGSSPSPITVKGQVFTPNPSAFSVAGTTLSAGGPGVTISGTLVSLGPSGRLVIGTSTTMLPSEASPLVFTVGGQTFTPNPTAFSIAGKTISAGGPGATLLGTLVSLGASGSLVIGTSTTVLSNAASSSIFTVGGQIFTANPTAFSVAGTTISAGGPGITISGTTVSLGQSGSLIIGTSITELSPTAFTVGNQVFTPNPTAFPIAQTTISEGGPGVTIAGTPVSLGPSGSLVIGNSTIQLSPTSTGVLGFTGQASCRSTGLRYEFLGLMLTCAMILTSH